MKEIKSFEDWKKVLKEEGKVYLLVYKKGSEKSDCAFEAISKAVNETKGIDIYFADVNLTRDIHPQYGIDSAPSLLEFEEGIYKNVIKGCSDTKYFKAMFEDALYYSEMAKDETPQKRVKVYSTPTCTWCNTIKSYFKQHRIRFTDIDVSTNQAAAEEMVRKSGQQGVPQTDINGEIIVGFDKGRINRLLGIQG